MSQLTLLMPAYNTLDRTRLAMLSLEMQSNKDFKIFILDNNSSDGTFEYLSDFCKISKLNITLRRNPENIGPSRNCLKLLENISDGYFGFIDSEDSLSADYVARVKLSINSIAPDVIFPKFIEFGLNGEGRQLLAATYITELPREARLAYLASVTNLAGIGYMFYGVYRTSNFKNLFERLLDRAIASPSRHMCEDVGLAYSVAASAGVIDYIPEIELLHRTNIVVNDARLRMNRRGNEHLYSITPPSILLEAIEIFSVISNFPKEVSDQLRGIVLKNSELLFLQHGLINEFSKQNAVH